jgi:hypothetical protein
MTDKQQAHMDSIRAARGLPPQTRENLMERVAAARTFVDRACTSPRQAKRAEMSAFMSIFHPEVPQERVLEMIRSIAP